MFVATILEGREKYEMKNRSIIFQKSSNAARWLLKTLINDGRIFCYVEDEIEFTDVNKYDTVEDFLEVNGIHPDSYEDEEDYENAIDFAKKYYKTMQFISKRSPGSSCRMSSEEIEEIIVNTNNSYLDDGWKYSITKVALGDEFSL